MHFITYKPLLPWKLKVICIFALTVTVKEL